jgi:hypothetical protein
MSDFEPITALSTRLKGEPCVVLSDQCAFDYDTPKAAGYRGSNKLINFFAPAKTKIGFHYRHCNQPVLPTLISEIATVSEPSAKFILYMGFEAVDDFVRFYRLLNITINPLLVDPLYQQLAACDGIISNAGLELSSECLVYGKNLLVKPPSD